jgi:hypothetical protein
MNAFIRFKLALTESGPAIKPYLEAKWADLPDTTESSIQNSIAILTGLHHRWVTLLINMSNADFEKTFVHPEYQKVYRLTDALSLYAWHCLHHLAHIKLALKP